MSVPNAASAFVPNEKLTDYLLNADHPVGGAKAGWFFSLGFRPDNPEALRVTLLEIVRRNSEFITIPGPFGVKYVVSGSVESPSGRVVGLCTVWIVETDSPKPRFVTAYPAGIDDDE